MKTYILKETHKITGKGYSAVFSRLFKFIRKLGLFQHFCLWVVFPKQHSLNSVAQMNATMKKRKGENIK